MDWSRDSQKLVVLLLQQQGHSFFVHPSSHISVSSRLPGISSEPSSASIMVVFKVLFINSGSPFLMQERRWRCNPCATLERATVDLAMLCCSSIPAQVRQNFLYTDSGFHVVFAGDQAVRTRRRQEPCITPVKSNRTTGDAALPTKKRNLLYIDLNVFP
jgi:hypothetical protein